IVKAYKKNDEELQLVLVVSAMGRKGAPYATDTLINLCSAVNDRFIYVIQFCAIRRFRNC
ncbi:hypothetical protein ACTPEM_23675, partial [Clostridioides difficile]